MDSPPAEPIKEANRADFEKAYAQNKARIDTVQALTYVRQLFEIL